MAAKIFMSLGATGYIAGDFLYRLFEKHPDSNVTCLVRNSTKGAKVAAVYPKVRLVYGDLDDVDLIESQAFEADIVYSMANCDHVGSAEAIARGLTRRNAESPAYWMHNSGAVIVAWESMITSNYGATFQHIFDDWDGISEMISFPDAAVHRNVDKIVLAAGSEKVRTAIVCPPMIYGPGRGPDNQRSIQAYETTRLFLEKGQAFKVGEGHNKWHEVHVQDLSDIYLALGEAAMSGGSPATWNDKGYYFAENGAFAWGDVLQSIANVAHKQGFLKSADMASYTAEQADKLMPYLSVLIGSDAQCQAIRGRKLLNWSPSRPKFEDTIPEIVESEARRAGIVKGHAAKVQE